MNDKISQSSSTNSHNAFNIAHHLAKIFVESKLVLALVPAVLLFGLIGLFDKL